MKRLKKYNTLDSFSKFIKDTKMNESAAVEIQKLRLEIQKNGTKIRTLGSEEAKMSEMKQIDLYPQTEVKNE